MYAIAGDPNGWNQCADIFFLGGGPMSARGVTKAMRNVLNKFFSSNTNKIICFFNSTGNAEHFS